MNILLLIAIILIIIFIFTNFALLSLIYKGHRKNHSQKTYWEKMNNVIDKFGIEHF